MAANEFAHDLASAAPGLAARFRTVRGASLRLTAALETEDYVVQSMPDVSPAKWHLAHTSWFFEQFLLRPRLAGYRVFHPRYQYLFNSYYEAVGPRHARPERGMLTRPTVDEILAYRAYVDEHMLQLLGEIEPGQGLVSLVELGMNHEQQHQELMLTDIKHVLSCNPLEPAYRDDLPAPLPPGPASATTWTGFDGGLAEIGTDGGDHFCFDNETPRHKTWLEPFELADRPVTNGEYVEFIRDGGYNDPSHWLADGWSTVQQEGWRHPLYWSDGLDSQFTLGGRRELDPAAPVCHLSLYEAHAFASWAGARLPTEAEWELAGAAQPVEGNFVESDCLEPRARHARKGLRQLYGDVWEWTGSAYAPYPGFRPAAGAIGEYNGKFMCSQLVLRGGSCATPADHVRPTYRNFFYPHSRWQFTGVRLARDGKR
jgi:ergothioneine biosynthesis protein EgtB